eukprot:10579249-Heterocapsa_arctica.AAC.1
MRKELHDRILVTKRAEDVYNYVDVTCSSLLSALTAVSAKLSDSTKTTSAFHFTDLDVKRSFRISTLSALNAKLSESNNIIVSGGSND